MLTNFDSATEAALAPKSLLGHDSPTVDALVGCSLLDLTLILQILCNYTYKIKLHLKGRFQLMMHILFFQ